MFNIFKNEGNANENCITKSYHYTSTKLAKIKKIDKSKGWQGYKATKLPHIADGNVKKV